MDKVQANVDGIWIVTERQGFDVQLTHFYHYIRGTTPPEGEIKTISLTNILKQRLEDNNGGKVTLDLGDLVDVRRKEVEKGFGFHFANVYPGEPESQVQYEYALSKLGLGIKPTFNDSLLSVDGQFRRLLSDAAKKKAMD